MTLADEFKAAAKALLPLGIGPEVVNRVAGVDVCRFTGGLYWIFANLSETNQHAPSKGRDGYQVDIELANRRWAVQGQLNLGKEEVVLTFPDSSQLAVPKRDSGPALSTSTPLPRTSALDLAPAEYDALDDGPRLLEPISNSEYTGVEAILAELWKALESATLTPAQEAQILAMAGLIEAEHRATEPGQSERWKLAGVVRGALVYLAKEAPKDTLAWWKLIELLQGINWTTLANHLPG